MKKRSICMLGLALVAAMTVLPARATLTSAVDFAEFASLNFSSYDPMINTYTQGAIQLYTNVVASQNGTSVTPTADLIGNAFYSVCTFSPAYYCTTNDLFPTQVVSPTALSIAPLGNSAHLTACLTPTSGPCKTFDLTLSQPQSLGVQTCLPPINCALPNAWVDTATNKAGASNYAFVGIARYPYSEVTGTFDGVAYVPSTYGGQFAQTFQGAYLPIGVAAP
ncbi:MAG: hypothetical protein ABR552_03520 [Actinomycetota bacterium]